jgi:hypothetical protein
MNVESYTITQTISTQGVDMELEFTTIEGKTTAYSPVLFEIHQISDGILYYTENKDGSLKHYYNPKTKSIVQKQLSNMIFELIDQERF